MMKHLILVLLILAAVPMAATAQVGCNPAAQRVICR